MSQTETSKTQESLSETQSDESTDITVSGKAIIVYYSSTGNTKAAAEYIASAVGGDIFELVPTEPYTDEDLDWTNENSRVSLEHANPELRNVELTAATPDSWEDYDTVFIGYPIWWGIAAWPVDGFIQANNFDGKTVIPFCTSASSGLGESGELLAKAAGTGNWLEGVRFAQSVTDEEVSLWISSLNI